MYQMVIPQLKKVEPEFGSSFVLRNFSEKLTQHKPYWHYHPELELVFIEEGSGKRHIGNHISYFNEGDLILIGSNLPHYGFSSRLSGINQEIVLQINQDCFGSDFFKMVETSSIEGLFEKAKMGLSFKGETHYEVGRRLKSMFSMTSFEKVLELLNIFHILSMDESCEILNANGLAMMVSGNDYNRIEVIYDLVRSRFASKISLDQVADAIHMTVPAFCRFFKKSTGKTFVHFLNEYRVTHACKLLIENESSILDISFDCGFNNLSNFNRAFKKVVGKSPSEYRSDMQRVILKKDI